MNSIIVTGASQGIGRATAEAFLKAGWRVGCLARSASPLKELAATHEGAVALPCDVTESAAVDAAFARFAGEAGRLDALFNNAGIGLPPRTIDEMTDVDWDRIVAVNLTGMFNCARAAFRAMRAQEPRGGRIVNNGSISARAPRWRSLGYTTTKHAITGMTKSLSLDGRDFDIACGQIDIGNAATEMTARMSDGVAQADGSMRAEPRMDVEDVARTVLQMCELPLSANVQQVTIMATKMPFVGRG